MGQCVCVCVRLRFISYNKTSYTLPYKNMHYECDSACHCQPSITTTTHIIKEKITKKKKFFRLKKKESRFFT